MYCLYQNTHTHRNTYIYIFIIIINYVTTCFDASIPSSGSFDIVFAEVIKY